MKTCKNLLKVFSLLIFVFIVGCSTSPTTGETIFNLLSEKEEAALGKNALTQNVELSNGEYRNKAVEEYFENVAGRISKISLRPGIPEEYKIVNTSDFNAFNTGVGYIAVNRGLFYHVNSEAEFAAILGHERAHGDGKHSASRMSTAFVAQAAVLAVDTYLATSGNQHYLRWRPVYNIAEGLALNLFILKYTRDQETEADKIGQLYLVKAGYHPKGMVEAANTMKKLRLSLISPGKI